MLNSLCFVIFFYIQVQNPPSATLPTLSMYGLGLSHTQNGVMLAKLSLTQASDLRVTQVAAILKVLHNQFSLVSPNNCEACYINIAYVKLKFIQRHL